MSLFLRVVGYFGENKAALQLLETPSVPLAELAPDMRFDSLCCTCFPSIPLSPPSPSLLPKWQQ